MSFLQLYFRFLNDCRSSDLSCCVYDFNWHSARSSFKETLSTTMHCALFVLPATILLVEKLIIRFICTKSLKKVCKWHSVLAFTYPILHFNGYLLLLIRYGRVIWLRLTMTRHNQFVNSYFDIINFVNCSCMFATKMHVPYGKIPYGENTLWRKVTYACP